MKKLFLMLAAAAAVASCSKDYTIDYNKEVIEFGNVFVDNATRATDPSYSTTADKGVALESFNVYGTVNNVNIFNGNIVSKGSAEYGNAWTMESSAPKQYWIAGANYEFVAVVDGNKTVDEKVITKTTVNGAGIPITITYNSDGATDLLCARVVRNNNTNTNVVAFEFTHLLSKVNFTVTNDDKDAVGYSFVVRNINFKGNVEGVYNVTDGVWYNNQFTTGYKVLGNERTVDSTTVKDIVVASGTASNELGTEVLFLPGEYEITFTVDILYNGNIITTTNYPTTGAYEFTLAQSNAYNFNVTVAVGDLIQFTATTMPDWDNGNTNDTDGDTTNDSVVLQ